MARAMWKASLKLGKLAVPVKLYGAVNDRGIHFRLLHAKDKVPVKQRMIDRQTGREVPNDEVRRGLEIEPGIFVVMGEKDLASVRPQASRDIDVMRVVPRSAIDLGWYQRPYWLGPDESERDYFALAAALADAERVGVAHWVLRGGHHFGILEARGSHLALIEMHTSNEVVSADQLTRPGGPEITSAERKLGEQLVATLDETFDPSTLRDEYRERVQAFIAAKAKGKKFEVEEAPAPAGPADLGEALRQSLKAAKKERRRAAA